MRVEGTEKSSTKVKVWDSTETDGQKRCMGEGLQKREKRRDLDSTHSVDYDRRQGCVLCV